MRRVLGRFLWNACDVGLGRSYASGDLSLVYPIARGIGPILIPVMAVLFLGEAIALLALLVAGGQRANAAFWKLNYPGDLVIPDGSGAAIVQWDVPFVEGQVITSVEYECNVVHTCVSDLWLRISAPIGNLTIWLNDGRCSDAGADDDPENDLDVYLNRNTDVYNGQSPAGTWYFEAHDQVLNNQIGYIDFITIKIFFDEPQSTGACCFGDGSCVVDTQAACSSAERVAKVARRPG